MFARTLVGGEPGIGKSTLLLQALTAMAAEGSKVLLVSAEESLQQVRLRAERTGALHDELYLAADVPTLIIWADEDPIFTDKYRQRCEAMFPNHATAVLHGVGHFLQSDAPDEFCEVIENWWAELADSK